MQEPIVKNADGSKTYSGKKVASLSNMSIEHQAALDSYMISDHPIDKLVKIIKEEWNELPESNSTAIRRMLYRYKDKNIKPKQAKIAAKHTSNKGLQDLISHITHLEDRLDPVLMLEDLVVQQKLRIIKMAKTEANTPTLLDSQTKNIGLMGDLLVKLIDAQLETGIMRRVPKKLDVIAVDITEEERQFLENSKLSDARAGFLVDAMRVLRAGGMVDVETVEVKNGN